jgi:hypothetical protein
VVKVAPCRFVYDPVAATHNPADRPLWSLVLEDLGRWHGAPFNCFVKGRGPYHINEVFRKGRRIFSRNGKDEIYLHGKSPALQSELFEEAAR